ncbi:GH32 C-terminal domain-containing protein [Lunatimonas salinarum]|uniref:GH32 C-terminal domain-containing protein n=1 Tax=Lunatimonas salinarum TaxID=1774590 RepID=UPI001AE0A195|nr:GH32 C-terminal domain-containing protein [Lunatimonas salinarum]
MGHGLGGLLKIPVEYPDGDFHTNFVKVHLASLYNGLSEKSIQPFLDSRSIEVFFHSGEWVMTAVLFPNKPYRTMELTGGATNTRIFFLSNPFGSKSFPLIYFHGRFFLCL